MKSGGNAVTTFPEERFEPEKYPEIYCSNAATLSSYDLENFDNTFFQITTSELTYMDPRQRLLLTVGYEAFHSAQYNKEFVEPTNRCVCCNRCK